VIAQLQTTVSAEQQKTATLERMLQLQNQDHQANISTLKTQIRIKFVWATIGKKILIDHISVKKEDMDF